MKISTVIGLNFGDEGKGNIAQALSSEHQTTAYVRFNGANQVGHTIIHNGIRHISSSFGAGVLKNNPVFYSKHTALNYRIAIAESVILDTKGVKNPKIIIDENAIVITPFDAEQANKLKNGTSTGIGLNQALQREKNHYHLRFRDILYSSVFAIKLAQVYKYYYHKSIDKQKLNDMVEEMNNFKSMFQVVTTKDWYKELNSFDHIIFEGGQGIMLDKHCGFYPYVTHSNTTMKNAAQIIKRLRGNLVNMYYVTRSYNTRHGVGPLLNDTGIDNLPTDKTNVANPHQGVFVKTILPLEQLEYAIRCNRKYEPEFIKRNLVITHVDELAFPHSEVTLKHRLGVSNIIYVRTPELKSI